MSPRRIRTLVVDDEALSRRGLTLRLASAPDFDVLGESANGRDALAAIVQWQPDLLFLDIQMPGMTGFEVVKQLPGHLTPLIVFVTAFSQHALQAIDAQAIDYLLKPIDEARFEASLQRVRQRFAQRQALHERGRLLAVVAEVDGCGELDLEELLRRGASVVQRRYPDALPIKQGRETIRVAVAELEWVDAAGDYMCLHAQGQTYILRVTMKELESVLDPGIFQRIHRSTIVNLHRVRSLRAHTNGEFFVMLDGGQELKLSRSFRDQVVRFLQAPLRKS